MTLWRTARDGMRGILSPKGLLLRAALCALFFVVCHVAGLRRFTAFLSGTSELTGEWRTLSALLGILYIAAYVAVTVVAPVFVLAAALLWVGSRRKTAPPAGAITPSSSR